MVKGAGGMQQQGLFDGLTIKENTAEGAKKTKQTNNRMEAVFELQQFLPASGFSSHSSPSKDGRGMYTNDQAGC
jgi:hypothetical protein